MSGHIYIVRPREFIRLNENIFKVGRTIAGFVPGKQILKRTMQYAKGTEQLAVFESRNCVSSELKILHTLQHHFKKRADFGNEYFEGNLDDIKQIVQECIDNEEESTSAAPAISPSNAIFCDVCMKSFNSQWELRRHGKRKNPCNGSGGTKFMDGFQIETMSSENVAETVNRCSPMQSDKECKFCKFEFTAVHSARRHEQHCKEDHTVRRIEIKIGIPLERYHEKDCRFCKKTFTRRQNMIRHQGTCPVKKKCTAVLTQRYKHLVPV